MGLGYKTSLFDTRHDPDLLFLAFLAQIYGVGPLLGLLSIQLLWTLKRRGCRYTLGGMGGKNRGMKKGW